MRHQAVRQIAKVTTRPATVRGINAYNSIVDMPEGFAVVLRNLYAQPYGCQMRKGFHRHCGGLDGDVETLMSHNVAGVAKLYGFVDIGTDNILYDVTTRNSPVQKQSGYLNSRWQHSNFANAAGTHLVAVNGADDMLWIQPNGTVSSIPQGSGTGNTISGVDPKSLIQVAVHQKRLWFVEKNTTRGWYLPVEQISGVAKSFDFGALWAAGGTLAALVPWTVDDGEGADDHLLAISSEGEIAVYKGTDPNGVETWALAGVYFAGAPVSGHRFYTKYGGDVIFLTQFGIVMMNDLLKSTKVNPTQENYGKYIQQILSAAIGVNGEMFGWQPFIFPGANIGWQPFIFPGANMVLINAPATNSTSYQLVMNDITKAWSEFLGYEAKCWELHNQQPFYGSNGAVYIAWNGTTDGSYYDQDDKYVAGSDVRAEVQSTFSYFDSLGNQKHFKIVRPTIMSRGAFSINLSVNTDFVFDSPLAPTTFATSKVGVWDEDYWDQAVWEGGLVTYKSWQAVTGIGTAASIRMLIRSAQETYWAATDWLLENGGVM